MHPLMDNMLALLGDHSPYQLFTHLFLEWVFDDICLQLVDTNFEDILQLAEE